MRKIFVKLADYFGSAWRLAVLDMTKGRWIVDPAPSRIGYLKAENANGRHILMQPVDESRYLLADDLCWERICRQHRHADRSWKPGRMVVETSPRNYQVWIRSQRPLSLDEKRYWFKTMGSDPGADPNNRWGRCPGFRNRKDKYSSESGRYPLARLIWIDWTSQAQVPHIIAEVPTSDEILSHPPPRGSVCRMKKICRSDYDRGGESETDFAYVLALARRGHEENEIRSRLLSERTSWGNHAGHRRIDLYLDRTVRNAKAIIEKTRHPSK
jgi:RepB DNA-primase N-terminal domain/RepB DNA-primase C-terminal helical domain